MLSVLFCNHSLWCTGNSFIYFLPKSTRLVPSENKMPFFSSWIVHSSWSEPNVVSCKGRFRRHNFDLRLSHATCSSHDLRANVAGFWNMFQNPTTFFELYRWVNLYEAIPVVCDSRKSKLCRLNRPEEFRRLRVDTFSKKIKDSLGKKPRGLFPCAVPVGSAVRLLLVDFRNSQWSAQSRRRVSFHVTNVCCISLFLFLSTFLPRSSDMLWTAPEHIENPTNPRSQAGDLYSYGIVLAEIVAVELMYDGIDDYEST